MADTISYLFRVHQLLMDDVSSNIYCLSCNWSAITHYIASSKGNIKTMNNTLYSLDPEI